MTIQNGENSDCKHFSLVYCQKKKKTLNDLMSTLMSTNSPATFLLLSSCPVKKKNFQSSVFFAAFNCCSSSADSLDSIYLPTTPKWL